MLKRFLSSKSGNFAITAALMAVPLVFCMGGAVDLSRQYAARSALQDVADGTALALAASRETDPGKLRTMADSFLAANSANKGFDSLQISALDTDPKSVNLALDGRIPTYFLGLLKMPTLSISTSALALREVTGSVELALVLDNTSSMELPDGNGGIKIDALKKAATKLVTDLTADPDAPIQIGLVPYADYVNVGTQYRSASWLSVGVEYTDPPPAPRQCTGTSTTRTICDSYKPSHACTKTIDGVSFPSTCSGGCAISHTETVDPYPTGCSGGGTAVVHRWFGCVGSRTSGTTRLTDDSPLVRYPGLVDTQQKCPTPLIPLVDARHAKTLTAGIDGMQTRTAGREQQTYIPGGLTWGWNLLSSPEPFSQGAEYDPNNASPRKVAVLMTDGENTLYFNSATGEHRQGNPSQLKDTNADTAAICSNMKARNIEIYSVAFMVPSTDAKKLLQTCASGPDHYFDAADADNLMASFTTIAQSLNRVRLAR